MMYGDFYSTVYNLWVHDLVRNPITRFSLDEAQMMRKAGLLTLEWQNLQVLKLGIHDYLLKSESGTIKPVLNDHSKEYQK